jgi:hypothetical protein
MEASVAIPHPRRGQIPQANAECCLILRHAAVTLAGARHPHRPARPPFAHVKADPEELDQFPSPGRL